MTETIVKTPSQLLIEQANKVCTIKDELGRTIKLKMPSIVDETRLLEILGKASENRTLLNYYSPLLYVVAIDEIPFMIGLSRNEIDAALLRLDRAGLKAVYEGINANFESNIKTENEAKEAIKKL